MYYRNSVRKNLLSIRKNERVQRATQMMRATQIFKREALHTVTSKDELKAIDNEKS